jgi:ribonuclease HI
MYYAVRVGKTTGVFDTWEECKEQVNGFSNAQFKKFKNKEDALNYIKNNDIIYSPQDESFLTDNIVEIYTDGACPNNSKLCSITAGIGVYFPRDTSLNVSANFSKYYKEPYTNQRAELAAIYVALDISYKNQLKNIIIYTDSNYSKCVVNEWMNAWSKNEWKRSNGEIALNLDIIKNIKELYDKMKEKEFKIEIKYIPGHKGIPGNEKADELARNAC